MDDPASQRPARLPALVAGFATLYLIWGSTYLGIKFAVETLPPLLMAGCRFLLAGSLLYAFLRWRGAPRPASRDWLRAGWTGALLLLLGNGLVTLGQQTVPSGRAALIVATMPLWMVIICFFFYGGERPGLRVCLGLAAGFAGAVLLVKPPAGEPEAGSLWGALLVAGAPLAWSVGSLETRRRPGSHGLLTSAMQMLAGGALLLAAGSLLGEWHLLFTRTVLARSVTAFFYLTVAGMVGFTTFAWMMRVASPTAVSTYAFVNPLVAVLLGWLLAGEALDAAVLLPTALIVGAVVLITLPRALLQRRQPVPEEVPHPEHRPILPRPRCPGEGRRVSV
jgi:drug/metabolite transporter (DMT)-like permease